MSSACRPDTASLTAIYPLGQLSSLSPLNLLFSFIFSITECLIFPTKIGMNHGKMEACQPKQEEVLFCLATIPR